MGKEPVSATPFVQTVEGKRIAAKKVEKTRREIIADDTKYQQKNVTFYSDGKKTYAKVDRKAFAPLISAGKINLYELRSTSTNYNASFGGSPAGVKTTNHTRWFIQDSSSNTVSSYGYKSLKALIPANSPAGTILKNYKKSHIVPNITLGVGGGLFLAGAIMAGGAVLNNSSDAKVNAGLYTMLGGAGAITCAIVIKGTNRKKLKRALNVHNGRQK
jgi:hypothetical protein